MQVRRATQQDAPELVATLSSAFAEDPLMTWISHGRPDQQERLEHLFRAVVGANVRRPDHELQLTAGGAAVWYPPHRWRTSTGELLRALPRLLRAFGPANPRPLRVHSAMEAAHPREPHVYLEYLGVRADRQGQGVGSALLADMCARLDRDGSASYLENSNPRNTPLYAAHGFVVRGSVPLPEGCPPLLPMWREPRT